MIEIELPDGSVAEFPEGTPKEQMLSAVKKLHMRQTVEKNIQDVMGKAAARGKIDAREFDPTGLSEAVPGLSEEERANAITSGTWQGTKEAAPATAGTIALGMGLANPVALAKGLAGAAAGRYLGRTAGREVGGLVGQEEIGSKVGGTLGGLAGGWQAAGGSLPAGLSATLNKGRESLIAHLLSRFGLPAVTQAAAPTIAAEVAAPTIAAAVPAAAAPVAAEVAPIATQLAPRIGQTLAERQAAFMEMSGQLAKLLAGGG